MYDRLRQMKQAVLRLFRILTLFSPRRAVRYFRSVSCRLDALGRLIESESACGAERGRELTLQLEKQIGRLEQRLEQMIAITTEELDRRARAQHAQAAELMSTITGNLDALGVLNSKLSKLEECEGLLRYLRRQDYHRAIQDGQLAVPRLETDHPIAVSPYDDEFPRDGTNNNSIKPRFNRTLYELFSGTKPLRVLDIGCSGGGFVRSLLDDGHFAVGLDGSDYSLLNHTGEWPTIPEHLFTCDVTKPFRLTDRSTNRPLQFDAITAWEVMEHILEEEHLCVFKNLDRHLAPGGLLLFSIATFVDWGHRSTAMRRVTVKPFSWWEDRFNRLGFLVEDRHEVNKDDWLRGSGQRPGDWCDDDGLGFYVALRRKTNSCASGFLNDELRASVA
jgi:SAM-dependent methyltransferase